MSSPVVDEVAVSAYRIPTDAPESDGTLEWSATTMVVVEITAGGETGLGYSYADAAAAVVFDGVVKPAILGLPALNTGAIWRAAMRAVRNNGQRGVAAMAVSAVDVAAWDLKGKLLGRPVADLLGRVHDSVPLYGSGGFTSYTDAELERQLSGWADEGFAAVKMKVGRDYEADVGRVAVARRAIGPDVALFIDANGAWTTKRALAFAEETAACRISWFEEPVSSNDLAGLRLLRDRLPPGIDVSAGEYGFVLADFRAMLAAGAVDVLQADVTRCGGITGFLKVAALAEAHEIPLSSHCAPALHVHPGCAAETLVHMEWFHDHARIEAMLFDGAAVPDRGTLSPPAAPGLGLALKRADAAAYQVSVGL